MRSGAVEAVRSMGLVIKFDYDTFLLDETQRILPQILSPAYVNAALAPTVSAVVNSSVPGVRGIKAASSKRSFTVTTSG